MARFAGNVGFAISTEVKPGDFRDVITEKRYFGDVTRAARQAITTDKVNDDFVSETTIEIIAADEFASEHMFAIRYVEWAGAKWKVINTTPQGVRLLLRLGGVYNGPTASVSN